MSGDVSTTRPTFLTTSWDDGHPLDLRVAELLAKHNLRGTFYVPRHTPAGTMTEAQVRELSAAFEIGGHTLDHVSLTRTTPEAGEREIVESKKWVEQVTGSPCTMFCPPRGQYTREHLAAMERAGYRGFRTVELLSLDLPRKHGSLFEMPTTLHAYPHPPMAYLRNAAKRGAVGNFFRFAAYGSGRDWPTLAHRLLQKVAAAGGVFHLWGHSWEVDQTNAWSQLEDVLKMMADHARLVPCLANGELCDHFATRVSMTVTRPDSRAAARAAPAEKAS